MTVAVVYCYPMVNAHVYFAAARRFAQTYQSFPAGYPHTLYVGCNGGVPHDMDKTAFKGVACDFRPRSNSGWDIGLFQESADQIPCDLMVCLGAPVHFHRAGWLSRMVDAYVEHGPGLYGCTAYLAPNWHVRTTSFWFPPILLQSYPSIIGSVRAMRYDFEHGNHSFTRHTLSAGLPCIMVTWTGCFPFDQWQDHAPDAHNILVRDQHIHL